MNLHRRRDDQPDSAWLRFRPMKYMCSSCGFIYDPAEGDPDGGIPPGTPFEEIPDTWFCPVCGARKQDFEPWED
jgi:rubredoxin